jgi:hypothetical protein
LRLLLALTLELLEFSDVLHLLEGALRGLLALLLQLVLVEDLPVDDAAEALSLGVYARALFTVRDRRTPQAVVRGGIVGQHKRHLVV